MKSRRTRMDAAGDLLSTFFEIAIGAIDGVLASPIIPGELLFNCFPLLYFSIIMNFSQLAAFLKHQMTNESNAVTNSHAGQTAAKDSFLIGGAEGQPVLTTKLSKDYIYSFRGDSSLLG